MVTKWFRRSQRIYQLALYGVRSSGKTCILSALSLPRVPHPDNFSCSWIESVPGHPLPAGDPENWSTDDPFHLGWKWLCEQRNRLRCGELPLPNPIREHPMRFRFAFGAPDQGTRQVDLLDYSGELITAVASELGAQLRDHMRVCDGLLILAEVPAPGHEHAPLAEDLEKLKGAFLSLLNEREFGPQPDWPIAVLFNKWDRRAEPHGEGHASPAELVDGFLRQAPPHESLVQTLRNAVGGDNVRCFPLSAFGQRQVHSDGAEVPVLDGKLLRSWRLEDGFIWLVNRCDELQLERLEGAAGAASRWAFWQTFLGRRDAADAEHSTWLGRWIRGVSPGKAISAGWRLWRDLPKMSPLRKRVACALRTLGPKLVLQFVVLGVLLLSLFIAVRTTADYLQYRTVLAIKADPTATQEQLQSAEAWLEQYFTAPGYSRLLSHVVVLGRNEAFQLLIELRTLLIELRTARDDRLWQAVTDTTDPQTKAMRAREYLDALPQGRHSTEAQQLVAENERQEKLARNREYLNALKLKIDAVQVDKTTDLNTLQALFEDVGRLPHSEFSSEDQNSLQQNLWEQVADKQRQIVELKRQASWEEFRQRYFSLMHQKNIRDAAKSLVERKPKEPELQKLVDDFVKRAPSIVEQKVKDELKNRAWQIARETAALAQDPNVVELLPAASINELSKLTRMIDEEEDRYLYSQILTNRPLCADQVHAYLTRAPLRTMEKEVTEYRQWLDRMKQPLRLTLTLESVKWDDKYGSWRGNYDNTVTVHVVGETVRTGIEIQGVLSKPSTRNADLRDWGSVEFQARLDDTITIDVKVVATYGWLFSSTMPGGSGRWTGTPQALRSGVTIDLKGDGFKNEATFSIAGIPPEPKLPEWSAR